MIELPNTMVEEEPDGHLRREEQEERETQMRLPVIRHWKLVILFEMLLLCLAQPPADSLKINSIGVPSAIANSSHVLLSCDYDLQGDQLYSVKWYKDYVEFYRYQPDNTVTATTTTATSSMTSTSTSDYHHISSDEDESSKQHDNNYDDTRTTAATTTATTTTSRQSQFASKYDYDLDGIHLNLALSNATHAYLSTTNLQSEGTYKCEVSVDAPSFVTVSAERQMKIYVLPKLPLTIYNNNNNNNHNSNHNSNHNDQQPTRSITINHGHPALVYDLNELVNLTCYIGASRPQAKLDWYINDSKAPDEYIVRASGLAGLDEPNSDMSPTRTSTESSRLTSYVSDLGGDELGLVFRMASHLMKQHQHQQQSGPHQLIKSLKLKCVAMMTLEFKFESSIIVAGGKTIKKQSSMPAMMAAINQPQGGLASALPLMMLPSPETFSHDPILSSGVHSSQPGASIYLWPQEAPPVNRWSQSGWRPSLASSPDQRGAMSYVQHQMPDQTDQLGPAQIRSRDFMINGMNSRDYLHQRHQLDLNRHINHIQKLLAVFTPNEAQPPMIQGTAHKVSNDEYELNDVIQFNCSSFNHVPVRAPGQTRLKWFINNQELSSSKINRYSNGAFYYEAPRTDDDTSVSSFNLGSTSRDDIIASESATNEEAQRRQRAWTTRPTNHQRHEDPHLLRPASSSSSPALVSAPLAMSNINQRHKFPATMKAMINYQREPEHSNEQTMPPTTTRWHHQIEDSIMAPSIAPLVQISSAGRHTRRSDPMESQTSGGNQDRGATTTRKQDVMFYNNNNNNHNHNHNNQPQIQTIPLEIELENSLYQLKELDIKCLLIIEQPIVEYNAQLSITNTPIVVKPANMQSSNYKINNHQAAGSNGKQSQQHRTTIQSTGQPRQSSSASSASVDLVESVHYSTTNEPIDIGMMALKWLGRWQNTVSAITCLFILVINDCTFR